MLLQPSYDFFSILNETQNPRLEIYTDGACSGNPGPGGWGALLMFNELEHELSGGDKDTTNNRMELMAPIEALKSLSKECLVDIYTDSSYVKDGITSWMPKWKRNGWVTSANTPVKNKDLWILLDENCQNHKVTWHWVKGHNGHPLNERADILAKSALISKRFK